MSGFDKLLRGANDRMDFDPYDTPMDPIPELKLTFKAKPKDTVGMEFEKKWQTVWKEGGEEMDAGKPREKDSSKLTLSRGDIDTTWTYSSEKFGMKGVGKLLTGNYKSDITGSAEYKFIKETWKLAGAMTLVTPDLGGAKIASSVDVEWEQNGATKVKPKVNFELQEEINVGVSAEHDTKELKKGFFQAVYAPKGSGLFWMRGDAMKKEFGFGCDNKVTDSINHSWEGTYNWGGDFAGIMGTSFGLRGGVEYELSDKTSLEAAVHVAQNWNINQNIKHDCNKNWSVAAWQTFDQELVGKKQGPYHIGFGATYKL